MYIIPFFKNKDYMLKKYSLFHWNGIEILGNVRCPWKVLNEKLFHVFEIYFIKKIGT